MDENMNEMNQTRQTQEDFKKKMNDKKLKKVKKPKKDFTREQMMKLCKTNFTDKTEEDLAKAKHDFVQEVKHEVFKYIQEVNLLKQQELMISSRSHSHKSDSQDIIEIENPVNDDFQAIQMPSDDNFQPDEEQLNVDDQPYADDEINPPIFQESGNIDELDDNQGGFFLEDIGEEEEEEDINDLSGEIGFPDSLDEPHQVSENDLEEITMKKKENRSDDDNNGNALVPFLDDEDDYNDYNLNNENFNSLSINSEDFGKD